MAADGAIETSRFGSANAYSCPIADAHWATLDQSRHLFVDLVRFDA